MSRICYCCPLAWIVVLALTTQTPAVLSGSGSPATSGMLADGEIGWFAQGAVSKTCNYEWWYGCSPTATGMIIGNYDRSGYAGLSYDNLVPGGIAESQTFSGTTEWDALVNNVIASPGHVEAFYIDDYFKSGDDLPRDESSFNCLADFMGTSQDSVLNVNGSTTFFYWMDGSKFYPADLAYVGYRLGIDNMEDYDGMYGIGEYLDYAGYSHETLYTQATDVFAGDNGFTLDEYQAEIDAGRPVLLHVTGHSMYGYGYKGDIIYLYDTWSRGRHSMTWDGTYDGRELWGVTVVELSGGAFPVPAAAVPEPAVWLLLALCGGGLGIRRLRSSG